MERGTVFDLGPEALVELDEREAGEGEEGEGEGEGFH